MKVTVGAIKQIVREETERLYEQDDEEKTDDVDPEAATKLDPDDTKMSPIAGKILDTDLGAPMFVKRDAECADKCTLTQQGEVLAGYIMNYLPDEDVEAEARKLMMKVKAEVADYVRQTVEKQKEAAAKAGGADPAAGNDEGATRTSGYADGKASDEGSSKTSGFRSNQSGRATDEGSAQTSGYSQGKGSDPALHSESRINTTLRRMIIREANSIRGN